MPVFYTLYGKRSQAEQAAQDALWEFIAPRVSTVYLYNNFFERCLMLNYFRTNKKLRAEIIELTRKLQDIDNEITQRERNCYFQKTMDMMSENEKATMELIRKHEARVISESEKAADDKELSMMEIIEKKETRIKDLELENIELRTSYRDFKNDVQEYEILTQTVDADLQAAQTMTAQLAAKFSGIKFRMERIGSRVDKKSVKLVTEGKG